MAMSPTTPVQIQAPAAKSIEPRPNRERVGRDDDFGREFKRELSRDRTEEARTDPAAKPVASEKTATNEGTAQVADNAEEVQAATVDPWLAMLQGVANGKVTTELAPDSAQLASQLSEGNQNQQSDEALVLADAGNALPTFNLGLSQNGLQTKAPIGGSATDPSAAVTDLNQALSDTSDAASLAASAAKSIVPELDLKASEPIFANELKTTLATTSELRPQSTLNTVQANSKSAEVPVHHIATPVGESRWGDAVAQRVGLMLGRQEQKIEMQLNPPNLGPMEVRLNLAQDQASVVFSSQNASVREALAAAMPKLTTLLADQGFTLTNVQVASDSLQQHQQQQHQNQQAATGSGFNQQNSNRNLGGVYGAQVGIDGEKMQELGPLRLPVAKGGLSLFV
ncbi:flagellar hook-length control protein FliK [Deefgea tanakiae]|uniref:Flagellar hook-length control protein FliK n=1 Tax=Deefgea tanakiae TaxID=2865840 RepID=A0ABX8Z513_9NEIS|nr:flagellar hook-length control protein FliK [Deefgea tanakiae]QZA76895.1 flagellar hook-length control protein FliK [Deefgea tanakiae]